MKGLVAVLLALVALGILMFLWGTSNTRVTVDSEADIAQIEAEAVQEVEAMLNAFGDAVLRGDARAVASFFTSDAVMLEPGFRMEGSEIPPVFDEVFGIFRYTTWDTRTYEFFVHGNVAYTIGEHDQVSEAEGQEPLVHNNYDFIRFEKVDGSWKIDRLLSGPRDAPGEG